MFLAPEELRELTGYKRGADQRLWLERAGIPHFVRSDGKPVVLAKWRELRDQRRVKPESAVSQPTLPFRLAEYTQPLSQIRNRRRPWRPGAGSWESGVYFLFIRWALVYVGKADCIGARVRAHRMAWVDGHSTGKPFTHFSWIEVPAEHNAKVELFYIHRDAPTFNVKDNINCGRVRNPRRWRRR